MLEPSQIFLSLKEHGANPSFLLLYRLAIYKNQLATEINFAYDARYRPRPADGTAMLGDIAKRATVWKTLPFFF